MGNVKQIGLAISHYSIDFNDYIMPSIPTFKDNGYQAWVQGLIIWGYLGKENFSEKLDAMGYNTSAKRPAGCFVCPSGSGNLDKLETNGGATHTGATTMYGLGYFVGSWSSSTNDPAQYAKKITQYRHLSKIMVLGEKRWGPRDAYNVSPYSAAGNIFDGMIRHNAYGNFLFFDFHAEGRKPNQVPSHTAGILYPATCANSTSVYETAFWANIQYINFWPGNF